MRFPDAESLESLASSYAGRALEQLVTQGGEGLRFAIYEAMNDAIFWHREKLKERPRGKNKG